MNDQIKKLKAKLTELNSNESEIKTQLQAEFNKIFDDWKELHTVLKYLENRENGHYHYNEYGDIDFSIDIDSYLSLSDDDREYLPEYLSEYHCAYLNDENGSISTSEGDAIVLNDTGDIFDGHDCIISKSDYESELKRNHLIEEYMEKTGCFPGVFESDRNGYLTPINTQLPIEKYDPKKESQYVVGIVSAHTVDIDDLIPNDAIDLTFESWVSDRRAELIAELNDPESELSKEGKTEEDIDDLIDSESEQYESDSTTYLIGDWIEVNGMYEINRNGKEGYAATFDTDSNNISVEFSQTILKCHHTSPCYRMTDGRPCGDLDTEGNSVLAYCMPLDFFR